MPKFDSSDLDLAVAVVERRLPRWRGRLEDPRLLAGRHGGKNLLVAFTVDDERLVLKVFQHSLGYRFQLLFAPLHRWLTKSFVVRATVRERRRDEVERTRAFREEGFDTFTILEEVGADALLYRFEEGCDLRAAMSEDDAPERVEGFMRRLGDDLRRRQERTLARRDLWLVHPHPRIVHVMLTPDDRFVYFDFEEHLHPRLTPEEAVVHELESFFFSLANSRFVRRHPPAMAVALDAVGPAALDRWEAAEPARMAGLHKRLRSRLGLLEEVRALAATA